MKFGWTEQAEALNGKIAMIAFVVMVGTYLTTGQIIPGVFWTLKHHENGAFFINTQFNYYNFLRWVFFSW